MLVTKITLDTKAPTGSIKINAGALFTNKRKIILAISWLDATSGLSKLFVKESLLTCGDDEFGQLYTSKEYTITSQEDGKKTIYVTLRDLADKLSKPLKASIILDTVAPTGTVIINGDKPDTTTPLVALIIKATKAAQMLLSVDSGITWLAWEKYSGSKKVTLPAGPGMKTVKVRFRDPAGNESSVCEDSIELQ